MKYPDIKIQLNGFAACSLLGKAEIITSFYREDVRIFLVGAITPVEERLQKFEMHHSRVKIYKKVALEQGYLIYLSTGLSGWFELIPYEDERFNVYEKQLLSEIDNR